MQSTLEGGRSEVALGSMLVRNQHILAVAGKHWHTHASMNKSVVDGSINLKMWHDQH